MAEKQLILVISYRNKKPELWTSALEHNGVTIRYKPFPSFDAAMRDAQEFWSVPVKIDLSNVGRENDSKS